MEILVTILCIWLAVKAIGLAFRMAWGATKIVVCLLFAVALPMLAGCLLFAGGLLILLPLGLLALAFGLLKAVV